MRLTEDERLMRGVSREPSSKQVLKRFLKCVVLLGRLAAACRRLSSPSGRCGGGQGIWLPTSGSGGANASIRGH